MAKDVLSWNDVKEKYLEFHKMDSFTENMAIDVDFGYYLVNNHIVSGDKENDKNENERLCCGYCGNFVE